MSRPSARFPVSALPGGPARTLGPTRTHEGGRAHALDPKSALFMLAVSRFGGEATFYEADGDTRFTDLVTEVTAADPKWMQEFIPWLRNTANMRTYAVQAAVDYAHCGGENGRQVIARTLTRADEPGEALAYAFGRYGRRLKMAVKRGIADAATHLYTDRSYVKWDSTNRPYRFGDVIELTHPKPRGAWQSDLFARAIDDRHGRTNPRPVPGVDGYRNWIAAGAPIAQLPDAATWENVSAHHRMDAASWEAIIPKMGYMALLRNLRNFEQAGVSRDVLQGVANHLGAADQVATSRQLPFRFWSAYRWSESTFFAHALETALEASLANIPALPGRTLVLVDVSGSMHAPPSEKSTVPMAELAAVFGAATIKRNAGELVAYATGGRQIPPLYSVLRTVEAISHLNGVEGHGTNTWPVCQAAWEQMGPFDRVFIFTDMQDHPSQGDGFIPRHVPVYSWDMRGYGNAHTNLTPGSGRYLLGGLSDQTFKLVPLLERGLEAGWPWEVSPSE